MARLPRYINGRDLARKLSVLGYTIDHQTGSHIQCYTEQGGKFGICIPDHSPLKVGMLDSILRRIANHHGISKKELIELLFR